MTAVSYQIGNFKTKYYAVARYMANNTGIPLKAVYNKIYPAVKVPPERYEKVNAYFEKRRKERKANENN